MKLITIGALAAALTLSASAADGQRAVLGGERRPDPLSAHRYSGRATLTLSGDVRIDIEVAEPTNVIVVNALELVFDDVTLDGGLQPDVSFDEQAQTARLTFPEPVTAGRHSLAITYRGRFTAPRRPCSRTTILPITDRSGSSSRSSRSPRHAASCRRSISPT